MRRTRHKILFNPEETANVEAVALAQFGLSTSTIAAKTKLTPAQVSYRLGKAARLEGLPPRAGYRFQWRTGESFAAKLILKEKLGQVEARVSRTLPKKIARPLPQFALAQAA